MKPDIENEPYGPHERNVFDLYLADSDVSTPLLFYVHGGGFIQGNKDQLHERGVPVEECLAGGISIASINYRLTDTAPFPVQMHDSARALQYIRYNADKWNIDPERAAACGPSAGSGISQWLAFHEDLADPGSDDPVERQSTRISCAVLLQSQSTYDPRLIKTIVPGRAYDNVAMKRLFGVPDDFNWDTDEISDKVKSLIQECGPITHLTADAPPALVKHQKAQENEGDIHHANFGRHLEKEMKKAGVECVRRMDSDYEDGNNGFRREFFQFLKKYLHK